MTLFDFIGVAADVTGLAAIIFTVLVFWRARQKLSQALADMAREYTSAPVALAIGIGQDISGAVRAYMQTPDFPSMPVRPYVQTGMVPHEKFYTIFQDLLKIKQELTDAGVTEVHLFYMGPVSLAIGVGAVFDNWVPVKVYKYVNGTYEQDFVLHKESVLGLMNITAEAAAEMLS